jgi:glycosyltransferase involved in cell wall biosynthesis
LKRFTRAISQQDPRVVRLSRDNKMQALSRIVTVVPCYNEESRLDGSVFRQFVVENPKYRFIFVNDGSTDATADVLAELCEQASVGLGWLDLADNGGKAEAVRRGVLEAISEGADAVAFWDADLATPLWELPAFVDVLERRSGIELVVGSRVKLMGRSIERKVARHISGRVFATVASWTLGLPFYDTQCGAKMFRVNELTQALFMEPFDSRWLFDVELCARLIRARGREAVLGAIYEYPLREWLDVDGSKVGYLDFLKATRELYSIYRQYPQMRKG